MDNAIPQPQPEPVAEAPRRARAKVYRKGKRTLYERPVTSSRTGQPLELVTARRRLNELTGTGHASPASKAKYDEMSRHAAAEAALKHAIADSMGQLARALLPDPDPQMQVVLLYDHRIGDRAFRRGTYLVDEEIGRALMEQETRARRMYADEDVRHSRVIDRYGRLVEVSEDTLDNPPAMARL